MKGAIFTIFILFSLQAGASDCPERSVGFGFASLDAMRNSINKSYDVNQHCQKHKKILGDFKNQKSDVALMAKSVARSKLVILGEEHHTPAQRDYGLVFEELKGMNPKVDCLFLEWSPRDEGAKRLIEGQRPESYMYLQHYEIVSAALKAKTKIFAVDGRDQSKKTNPRDLATYVRDSNEAIFKNIQNLFDSGTCAAGVLVIGKAHVEHPQIQIDPKDSIKSFFERSEIPVVAINFVYTGKNEYANNIDQQWQWNVCTDEPVASLKAQIVISKDRLNKSDAIVITPVSSFDYYLFMPEVDQKRMYP